MLIYFALALCTAGAALLITIGSLSRSRSRRVADTARRPVLIDGELLDPAEVIWSLRQATRVPSVEDLSDARSSDAEQLASLAASTVEQLDAASYDQFVRVRTRLESMRAARERLAEPVEALASTAAPAAADALAIAVSQAVGSTTISQVGAALGVTGFHSLMGGAAAHLPADHLVDAGATLVGEGAGHLAAAIVDAHVPVFTIVTAAHRARGAHRAGLEGRRVAENLAWDVGAKGGAVAAGAAIGTAVFPGVGTVVGGVIGAVAGSGAAHAGKRRHLREAQKFLDSAIADISSVIDHSALRQITEESLVNLTEKQRARQILAEELAHYRDRRPWWARKLCPSLGWHIFVRTLDVATADLAFETSLHQRLVQAVRAADSSPVLRTYLWTTATRLLTWVDLKGPDTTFVAGSIERVAVERGKLKLAAGRH